MEVFLKDITVKCIYILYKVHGKNANVIKKSLEYFKIGKADLTFMY